MSRTIDPHRLQLKHYPFRLAIETQFGDMDVVGHVSNVAIARFYENARSRFLMKVFHNPQRFRDPRYGIVVAEYTLRFLAEANYPDPVEVGTGISRIGRSSVTVHQALFQKGQCVGLCDAAMVLTSGGQPLALPPEVRERLSPLMVHGAT